MTKFTNRIKPDSTELERYFLSVYTGNLWDALEKIKDWHSPEHIEKEVQMKLLKLQQQALPVVPEWLDIEIKHFKSTSKHPTVDVVFGVADAIVAVKNGNTHSKLYDYLFCGKQDVCNQHQAIFALAFITGKYTVEKPQLFKLIFPNSTAVLQKDGELNSFADTVYKRCLIGNAMTEQEIKSIDERYWQFAVPVEDGE